MTNIPNRSAFARRLSKRMRNLQTPDNSPQLQAQSHSQPQPQPQPQPEIQTRRPSHPDRATHPAPSSEKTISPPIDSAYASSIEKPLHRQTPQQPQQQSSPAFRTPPTAPSSEQAKQPIKGFTLFPKTSEPSMASSNHTQPSSRPDEWAEENKSMAATSMQSKGVSFGSVRRYFHLRKGSRKWG